MRRGDARVFGADIGDVAGTRLRRHEALRDADGAAGIVDIDRLTSAIVGMDFHRCVHAARGRAADEQGQVETLALHLAGDMAHLVE